MSYKDKRKSIVAILDSGVAISIITNRLKRKLDLNLNVLSK
ncbi:23162_t:CDS:1, partial [Gigaspora rosea]